LEFFFEGKSLKRGEQLIFERMGTCRIADPHQRCGCPSVGWGLTDYFISNQLYLSWQKDLE
jgi:hypothetical protein